MKPTNDDAVLRVRVRPRSRKPGVERDGDQITVHVSAAPVDGKANDAVRRALADALDIPMSHIILLRGTTSTTKDFTLVGVSENRLSNFCDRIPTAT